MFGSRHNAGPSTGTGGTPNLRNLNVGRHTYVTTVEFEGREIRHVINIVPRGSQGD